MNEYPKNYFLLCVFLSAYFLTGCALYIPTIMIHDVLTPWEERWMFRSKTCKPKSPIPVSEVKVPTKKSVQGVVGVYIDSTPKNISLVVPLPPSVAHEPLWPGKPLTPDCYTFNLSLPSAKVFKNIFQQVFKEAVEIENKPQLMNTPVKLDGIIEQTLIGAWNDYGHKVRVSYQFNFYSPSGDLISSFKVAGEGEHKKLDNAIGKAIEDAAMNFQSAFLKNAGMQGWLYRIRSEHDKENP